MFILSNLPVAVNYYYSLLENYTRCGGPTSAVIPKRYTFPKVVVVLSTQNCTTRQYMVARAQVLSENYTGEV